MRKPKTPLLSFVRRAVNYALIAETKGSDYAEELREQHAAQPTRREFLAAGALAAGGLILSAGNETWAAQTAPQIAIVGGGIAGLNAANYLWKRHPASRRSVKIYEAGDGNWGRIQTKQMGYGTAELGGEFIDTGHDDMHCLVREFGLELLEIRDDQATPPKCQPPVRRANIAGLIKDAYFFEGRHYSETDVLKEFRKFVGRIIADSQAYEADDSGPRAKVLDRQSLEQYFKERLKLKGWMYEMLTAAYTGEFGLETGEQSALNFITMISTDTKSFEVFGESDERYKIRGGNGQLITKLRERLATQIETGHQLTALKQQAGGKHVLTFERGKLATADYVILALPFSTMRGGQVDLRGVKLPREKRDAIEQLGYGTNSKLLLSLGSRVWRKDNRSGNLINREVHNGWETSLGQNEDRGPGGYTVYLGGQAGLNLEKSHAERYINELDRVFKGFRDTAQEIEPLAVNWSKERFTQASYSSYKPGQWTTISGAEGTPVGKMFFCGEHCSGDFQGYMNGGAETGRRAATELMKALAGKRKAKNPRR